MTPKFGISLNETPVKWWMNYIYEILHWTVLINNQTPVDPIIGELQPTRKTVKQVKTK